MLARIPSNKKSHNNSSSTDFSCASNLCLPLATSLRSPRRFTRRSASSGRSYPRSPLAEGARLHLQLPSWDPPPPRLLLLLCAAVSYQASAPCPTRSGHGGRRPFISPTITLARSSTRIFRLASRQCWRAIGRRDMKMTAFLNCPAGPVGWRQKTGGGGWGWSRGK